MTDSATSSDTNNTPSPPYSETEPPADGEIAILYESLNDIEWEDLAVTATGPAPGVVAIVEADRGGSISSLHPAIDDYGESCYGNPLSEEKAAELMPTGSGESHGLLWNALVIPDEMFADAKTLSKALGKNDFDHVHLVLKPRRASLPIRASHFFSSLTRLGPRFIFNGVLNGWPGLRVLELVSIEERGKLPGRWNKIWEASNAGSKGIAPSLPSSKQSYRAWLRGAPWTAMGWSKDSLGYAFWYEACRETGPSISYGTNILTTVERGYCSWIHMISHRYAVQRESPRDLLTYHSICLLEWDHGRYTTVLETAYLNGIGGYRGRSNWYHDKDEPKCQLYQMMPPEMILPWRSTAAEIRAYDVPVTSLTQFLDYMNQYKGKTKRFVDPRVSFSHAARLTFRSKEHIAQYILNYISRDSSYGELRRNCQTFAADMCSFIAGKKDVSPFHPVNRIEYQNRTYLFLYDSHMYRKKVGTTK